MPPDPDPADVPASPYGPHPRGVDEAAGGADSSPHEDEPTGERKAKADADPDPKLQPGSDDVARP